MMGMGEPLDNFENTAKFLRLVNDEKGINLSLRHLSLSTCGVVTGIQKLAELKLPITLSVSLHAPNDAIRNQIMPINKRWNVEALLNACRDYQKATKRRISFEYALMEGLNDSPACAKELAKRLKGMLCHINLIPANPVKERGFKRPDKAGVQRFQAALEKEGLVVTVRRTLGADISASCGQLRKKVQDNNLR